MEAVILPADPDKDLLSRFSTARATMDMYRESVNCVHRKGEYKLQIQTQCTSLCHFD
jgi:hypothetical protein